MRIKKIVAALLAATTLGVTTISATSSQKQVEADDFTKQNHPYWWFKGWDTTYPAFYIVSKSSYAQTAKGKKTKAYVKAYQYVKVYRTVKLRGKKYYYLSHDKYISAKTAFRPLPLHVMGVPDFKHPTRTINLYMPNSTKAVVKQKASIMRDVSIYPKTVTKKTKAGTKTDMAYATRNGITFGLTKPSFGKWSTSSWKSYTVPTVSGYTASIKKIGKKKVYHTTKNQTVKVTYRKNKTSKAKAKKTTKTTTKKSLIKVR